MAACREAFNYHPSSDTQEKLRMGLTGLAVCYHVLAGLWGNSDVLCMATRNVHFISSTEHCCRMDLRKLKWCSKIKYLNAKVE